MFSGIMNAERLDTVYEAGIIPFIQGRLPDSHRLYQDNDLIHSSKYIEKFLKERFEIGGIHHQSHRAAIQ